MKKYFYPGSFDPLTMGHLDIMIRASKLCDQLVVGIVTNSSKTPLLSVEERKMLAAEAAANAGLTNVEVVAFDGLLADFFRDNGISAIVRGLRDTPDFTSEMPRAYLNKRLNKDFETIFLLTDIDCSYISSTAVKEMMYFGTDVEGMVPDNVSRFIKEKIARR